MIFKTLSFSALVALSWACSGKQARFGSSTLAALEIARNSDGVTADLDAQAVYGTAGVEASEDGTAEATGETNPVASGETTQEADGEPIEQDAGGGTDGSEGTEVSADLKSEASNAALPTATGTAQSGGSKSGSKNVSDSPSHPESKDSKQPKEERNSEPQHEAPGDKSSLISACLEELDLAATSTGSFSEHTIAGKNKNNRVLFSDKGPDKTPLLLHIHLKNVNRSSLELLNPERVYCVDMQVKNMNKFKFTFHCDAKIAFVNLKRKNSNKAETLRVQCAQ